MSVQSIAFQRHPQFAASVGPRRTPLAIAGKDTAQFGAQAQQHSSLFKAAAALLAALPLLSACHQDNLPDGNDAQDCALQEAALQVAADENGLPDGTLLICSQGNRPTFAVPMNNKQLPNLNALKDNDTFQDILAHMRKDVGICKDTLDRQKTEFKLAELPQAAYSFCTRYIGDRGYESIVMVPLNKPAPATTQTR